MEKVPTFKKGNFKYDKNGKIVFRASKTGRWVVTTDQAFKLISDTDSPIYKRGIDPYTPKL